MVLVVIKQSGETILHRWFHSEKLATAFCETYNHANDAATARIERLLVGDKMPNDCGDGG